MANAAATMVGQSLGARNPARAERAVWQAGFYNMIFLGVVGLLFILFAPQIIGFYTSDPDVARYGVDSCAWLLTASSLCVWNGTWSVV